MEGLVGVVKWFDSEKGYGFIVSSGKDYFCHFKAIKGDGFKSLDQGQRVSFNLVDGKKGKQADAVELI